MTDHPMQPSDDQIREWRLQAPNARDGGATREHWIARTAYAAGADAQLDRGAKWVHVACGRDAAQRFRAEMRPKPPSLADLAVKDLAILRLNAERYGLEVSTTKIEAALERLAELEGLSDG